MEKRNLSTAGIVLIIAGLIGFVWGTVYIDEHRLSQSIGSLIGRSDPLFTFAQISSVLGVIAFITGIVLIILTITKKIK